MKEKKNTIKSKVIGGFLLVLLAMVLTGIISYNSYRELLSVNQPQNPDQKLKKLSQILADISEAEANMRAYALTRNPEFLETYGAFASTVNGSFEQLKLIEPVDVSFNQRIDSTAALLNEKIEDLNSFIDVKRAISDINFSLKALDEISNSTDSVPALRTTKTTTTTTTTLESIAKPQEESPALSESRKKKRNRKRVQELAKQIAKLEREPMIQTETKIITDTSFIQPDTVLGSIEKILEDVSKEERRYQKILASKELVLIEGNIEIIDQIRNLINTLEQEEVSFSIAQANKAKVIANQSTLTVSIIIILCLVTGIALVYFILKDINFRNFYHQQLIGAKNQAEQLAESKQQFLASMSHEIRTPLNAIIGFTEQLNQTELGHQQQQYLKAVHSSSEHLLNTVNDILDYSKLEAGELTIAETPFDLHQNVREVVENLRIKAKEKKLNLNLETTPFDSAILMGDPFRLKQILYNLISNALKFTDTGFVKVLCKHSTLKDQSRVEIAVMDSGVGIKKEQFEEIFKDFSQVDLNSRKKHEGTGLGLAITKRLIEVQKGSIKVDSEPGKGSTFIMQIDYQKAPADWQPPQIVFTDAQEFINSPPVMVVDDDPFNLKLLATILDKWKVPYTLCDNAQEALDHLLQDDYALVLTDINMPGMSGLELCENLRSHKDVSKQNLPIVALTANVMKKDLDHYRASGINEILLKPFKEQELGELLAQHLSIKPAAKSESTTTSDAISWEDFNKFSGGDDEALLSILDTFYSNLQQNMEALKQAEVDMDLNLIADLAHKMISSFGHLKLAEITERLRTLEIQARKKEVNHIPEGLAHFWQSAQPIMDELGEKVHSLKDSAPH